MNIHPPPPPINATTLTKIDFDRGFFISTFKFQYSELKSRILKLRLQQIQMQTPPPVFTIHNTVSRHSCGKIS